MHASDREPKGTRVRRALIATLVACSLLSLLTAAGARAALIRRCPSASALEGAAGTPLTIGTHKVGMDVFCDYTHPLSQTLKDYVSIAVEPMRESNAAFERNARAYARDLKARFTQLHGIGNAAWEYTEPRSALDGGGNPTTTVTIVVGRREVTVISNLDARNVLAVAKQVS